MSGKTGFSPEPMAEWLEKNKGKTGIENFKGVDMERFIAEQRGRDAEGGNVAKLREALEEIERMAQWGGSDFGNPVVRGLLDTLTSIRDKAKAALAAPPRNCDVGTVEEQKERLAAHCKSTKNCRQCPYLSKWCAIEWANAAVEKEGGDHADAR